MNIQASSRQMEDDDMDLQNYKHSKGKIYLVVILPSKVLSFKPTKHDERDAQVCGVVGGPGQVEYPSSSEA